MDSPRSPQVEAQVELPEEAPRALTGRSHYRVNSDSMLEELQQQLHQGAMGGASLAASERLEGIVPDPGDIVGKSVGGRAKDGDRCRASSTRPSIDADLAFCSQQWLRWGSWLRIRRAIVRCLSVKKPCIDRLCVILLLPAGVVLHGRPWWVATVRSAAVLVSIMQWAACLYPAATGGNTGWQMGSCLAACVGSNREPDPLVAENLQHQLPRVQQICEGCHAVPKHGSSPKVGHQTAHPCDHLLPRQLDALPCRKGPTCCNGRWADDMASRRIALPPMPVSGGLGVVASAFKRVCQRARGCLLPQLCE